MRNWSCPPARDNCPNMYESFGYNIYLLMVIYCYGQSGRRFQNCLLPKNKCTWTIVNPNSSIPERTITLVPRVYSRYDVGLRVYQYSRYVVVVLRVTVLTLWCLLWCTVITLRRILAGRLSTFGRINALAT